MRAVESKSVRSESDSTRLRTELAKKGYVLLPQFFSGEEIARLEKEVRTAPIRSPSALDVSGLVFRENVHEHSPYIQGFVSQPKVVDLIATFAGGDFVLRKDQGVFKAPQGAEFPWHQDNGYNGITDSYFQLWVPLTDATPDNGGLFVVPGSHRHGLCSHTRVGEHLACAGDDSRAVPIVARRGDAVVFSSLLLHRTAINRTRTERVAYVAEFIPSAMPDPEVRFPCFRVARRGRPAPKFVYSLAAARVALWRWKRQSASLLHGTLRKQRRDLPRLEGAHASPGQAIIQSDKIDTPATPGAP